MTVLCTHYKVLSNISTPVWLMILSYFCKYDKQNMYIKSTNTTEVINLYAFKLFVAIKETLVFIGLYMNHAHMLGLDLG